MNKINRTIDNLLAIVHDLATEAEEWMSRPSWLEYSTNNICNLRCIMCPQADGEPAVIMKREDAERLLGDLMADACVVTPSAGSEPVLGNMDLILEHCRREDVFLDMYSNGTVLDVKRFRAMADRIHKLHISFDSHVKETFEHIRVGAKYDVVVRHIEEIVPAAVELGVPLGFIFVIMADNAHQLPDYIDFLGELGVQEARAEVRVQPMLYIAKACDDQTLLDRHTEAEVLDFVDRAAARAEHHKIILQVDMDEPFRRKVVPVQPPLRAPGPDLLKKIIETIRVRYPQFCSMASYYMKVSPDGSVFPCCRAPDELCMGNVLQQPVHEIWNGERYRDFRRRMFAGDYPETCSRCDVLVSNPAFKPPEPPAPPAPPGA